MPVYEFQCPECGQVEEKYFIKYEVPQSEVPVCTGENELGFSHHPPVKMNQIFSVTGRPVVH